MYKFIMLAGLPGSLKSTYARNYIDIEIPNSVEYVSSDEIRKELNLEQGTIANVFDIVQQRILKSVCPVVIFDATNLRRKHRVNLLKQVKQKHPFTRTEIVFHALPIKVCKYFNNQRKGFDKVPEYVYDRMLRGFDMPLYQEGWDYITYKTIYSIDFLNISNIFFNSFDELKSKFISATKFDMIAFDQDNPHHTLTLDRHCAETVNYVIERYKNFSKEEREILRIAAEYHDIGKVITKDYHKSNGEPSETAHYYGHENAGAYIMLSEYSGVATLPQTRIYQIAKLINFHMKVSFSWKDNPYSKATLEGKKYFTGRELAMLELLGEADRNAH